MGETTDGVLSDKSELGILKIEEEKDSYPTMRMVISRLSTEIPKLLPGKKLFLWNGSHYIPITPEKINDSNRFISSDYYKIASQKIIGFNIFAQIKFKLFIKTDDNTAIEITVEKKNRELIKPLYTFITNDLKLDCKVFIKRFTKL